MKFIILTIYLLSFSSQLLAEEDAERGMYFVSINFGDNDINIIVETPLVKYIDNTCIKLN